MLMIDKELDFKELVKRECMFSCFDFLKQSC